MNNGDTVHIDHTPRLSHKELAYAMQKAYLNTPSKPFAIEAASLEYPGADRDILDAMWHAIDAYVDMNPES